jgi:hypothetical protein
MKNALFWGVAPCRSCVNRRFGGTYRLRLQGRKIRERETNVSRWQVWQLWEGVGTTDWPALGTVAGSSDRTATARSTPAARSPSLHGAITWIRKTQISVWRVLRLLLPLSQGTAMMQQLSDVRPQLENRCVRGQNHAGHSRKEKQVKCSCWGSNFCPLSPVHWVLSYFNDVFTSSRSYSFAWWDDCEG